MISEKKKGIIKQIFIDWFNAAIAWLLLYLFRKIYIENNPEKSVFNYFDDANLLYGLALIPLLWLSIYFLTGTYTDIYRKSRLKSFNRTFMQTLSGSIILFFAFLLDDIVGSYKNYYYTFGFLFTVHFLLTVFGRLILLTLGKVRMHKGDITFPAIIIGSNAKAVEFYKEHLNNTSGLAYKFEGFVNVSNEKTENGLSTYLPLLGTINNLESIIQQYKIEDVIIAIDSSEHESINQIINELSGRDVVIKIIPGIFDILLGKVKMSEVTGAPLIEIYPDAMPRYQIVVKRLVDVIVSVISLVLLSPLLVFIAIKVKLSSPGNIFYLQERIGHRGKPFQIIKFRSMIENAEQNGPALSSENDARITPWGKIMRKWRLDELPQFINVLKGDMSLIGPRPERQYFIDKMMQVAPHCKQLLRVKPGITSLGMVKYGYAENVEEMIERLKYDIIYIESQSLLIDFKIFIYTIITLLKGRGK